MGFDEGSIIFDRVSYNAGEMIRGKVVFKEEQNKSIKAMYIEIKGYCDVRWTTTQSRTTNDQVEESHTVEHSSYEKYIEMKINLIGGMGGEVLLKPGHYEYPFECMIPTHCPSSFESSNGHIRYEVKAVVERSFFSNQEKRALVTVINVKDLNKDPSCIEPIMFESEESYCCWCMSVGYCEVVAKLPQTGYCPGQTINIELSCTNNSNVTIKEIKFELIERRTFTASNEPDTRHEEKVVARLKKGSIEGNTTQKWVLELYIPPADVYNLDTCQFIDIRHELKMVVSPSGCHRENQQTRRIILGHIPLGEYKADPIIAQPIAPSMAQYPGGNPAYPNPAPTNPPYTGANFHPSIPYPGAIPAYPGANTFPSQLPGVSPYPIGSDPFPGRPGFNM